MKQQTRTTNGTESTAFLSAALNQSSEGIVSIDTKGKITFINQRAKEFLGSDYDVNDNWSRGLDILDNDWESIVHTHDGPLFSALTGNTIMGAELVIKSDLDMSERYLRVNARPIWDEMDNIIGAVGNFIDVSGEQSLRYHQDAIFKISKAINGQYRTFEGAAASVKKLLSEYLRTNNLFIADYDEFNNRLNFPFVSDGIQEAKSFAQRTLGQGLTEQIISGNQTIWLSSTGQFGAAPNSQYKSEFGSVPTHFIGVPILFDGKTIGAIGVSSYDMQNPFKKNDVDLVEFIAQQLSPIIEREHIKRETLKHENYRKELERFSSDMTLVINSDWNITYSSERAVEFFDTGADTLVGRMIMDIIQNETLEEFIALAIQCEKTKAVERIDLRCDIDGSTHWLEITARCLSDDPLVGGLVVNAREISAEQLTKLELEMKNAQLEQFAYVTSHDLQEPLQTLMSFKDLLVSQYQQELEGDGEKYLEYISQASRRMSELIKALMDHAQLGANSPASQVDCNEVLQKVLADFGPKIKQTKAQITCSELPSIRAHKTELRFLFFSLVSNALKFHQLNKAPSLRITASEEEGLWRFSFQDQGIGIADKNKKNVFRLFRRLNSSTAYSGVGIGLAHCRKIVDLHGGDIWLESKIGNGSNFIFTIPKEL